MRDYAYFEKMGWKTRLLNALRGIFRISFLERWIRQRTVGRDTGSFWVKLMPPEYSYPKGSRRSIERDGLRYELDISNATDHGAYFGYADRGDDNLGKYIKPTDTIIDIGGNIGVRAMHFARLVPQGKVVTFEPDPDNFARLQRHLTINGLENVVARPYGIGPEEATHRLYQVVESNSGMNRIITQGEDLSRFPYKEVRVLPLSKGLEGSSVTKVDVIKIDVEGFEMEVLKGCAEILQRDRPVLFVELDDANLRENGTDARGLIAYVEGQGYTVLESGTMKPISVERHLAQCHFDILCVPRA
jgi:FkbM family methyltransferase